MPEMPEPDVTFEQALAGLEQIVLDLEDGQIGLEQALDRYEKGIGLLKHCYGLLERAEQRIQLLVGLTEAGQPVTQPFTPAAEEPAAKEPVVADRRKKRKKAENAEDGARALWFGQ
jgi:exodeoxyribonuclease VII small subunit